MVLTRRGLLGGALALPLAPLLPALSCAAASRRKLVVVAARGGWDTTFAFDPKLGLPGFAGPDSHAAGTGDDTEALATIGGIPLVLNAAARPSVTGFFTRWADRAVVVNGVSVGSIAHVECVRRVWTGGDVPEAPDLGAIVGAAHGAELPIGYLDIGTGGIAGHLAARTARLGWNGQAAQLAESGLSATDRAAVARWRARRASRAGLPEDDATAVARADALGEALAALALDPGDPVGAAVSALEADLCAAAFLDPKLDWDTHDGNAQQNGCWQSLFALLDSLATELDARALLDDTLVLVLSEMGRTPWQNRLGGKDHWPVTSALLFGGGLAGGRVLGGTDEALGAAPVDVASGAPWSGGEALRPANVLAGAAAWLDVDPAEWFPGVTPLAL